MALGALVVLLLFWLAPHWTLAPLARYLDVSEAPQPVDYVLVLNGDPETRPFAAAAFVRAHLAGHILLTRQDPALESATVQDGKALSELELTRHILRARGVPDDAVQVLPGTIGNTLGEAQALAAFLDEHPDATVAVVTNGFHTRRARRLFTRFLHDRMDRVHFVGVPREGVNVNAWWRSKHGCAVYLSEYAKLAYYTVR
jgi:uncharacterized SAM-binding protein YcdF (DUF218 family)